MPAASEESHCIGVSSAEVALRPAADGEAYLKNPSVLYGPQVGILVEEATRRRRTLGVRNLIGRVSSAPIASQSPMVSAEHGVFFFRDDCWFYRDLGSTNGSWLADAAIAPGRAVELGAGAVLYLGERTREHEWVLVDDTPPMARAIALGASKRVDARGSYIELESGDHRVVVFFSRDQRTWLLETDDCTAPVADQSVIQVGSTSYVLELPWVAELPEETNEAGASTARDVSQASFDFTVSANEEQVFLTLSDGEEATEVPPRSHHYLLLHLARQRLADRAAAVTTSEAGWLDVGEVARALRVSRQKLNLDISRARRQLADLGFDNAVSLVERRPQAKQLRLGGCEWCVTTGS